MPAPVALAGELGLIGLFDLGQLLMLNGATGVLSLSEGQRRCYLYFDKGQLTNAVDEDHKQGEAAAYRIFAWKEGRFEFKHEAVGGARGITETTESIMLEAARQMDEAGLTAEGDSATERLQSQLGMFQDLRDAFHSVVTEAQDASAVGDDGTPFSVLRETGDTLLYRAGQIPRARIAGQWRSLAQQPLDPGSFEQLRSRLLDPAWPPVDPRSERPQRRTVPVDGRMLDVTRLAGPPETLWVRAAGLAPADPARWSGAVEALPALIETTSGLVLVGAPSAQAADALLHGLLERQLAERGGQTLLVAESPRYAHADGAGALVHCTLADALDMLRIAPPERVVFECASAAPSLATLPSTPLVLCAVIAPDAGSILTRWLASHGRRLGDGIENLLASAPLGVVHTSATRVASTGVPVVASFLRFDAPAAEAEPAAAPQAAPQDEAAPSKRRARPAGTPAAAAPAPPPAPPPTAPARTLAAGDPMRALAEELTRQLKRPAA